MDQKAVGIIVPHYDDEALFCWTELKKAARVGYLVEGGFQRSIPATEMLDVWFGIQDVRHYGMREKFPEYKWGVWPEPLDESEMNECMRDFLTKPHNLNTVIIPGRSREYGHRHHIQLEEWCDRNLEEKEVYEVCFGRREAYLKRSMIRSTYSSVLEGLTRWEMTRSLMEDGVDHYITYTFDNKGETDEKNCSS